jgi:hypothetical protein
MTADPARNDAGDPGRSPWVPCPQPRERPPFPPPRPRPPYRPPPRRTVWRTVLIAVLAILVIAGLAFLAMLVAFLIMLNNMGSNK